MSDLLPKALIDTHGFPRELGAFVVAASFDRTGTQAAFGLGSGELALVDLSAPETENLAPVHDGALLSLTADIPRGFITGGDDGVLARVAADGSPTPVETFGSKWVEHLASFSDGKAGLFAAAVGKFAYLFDRGGGLIKTLAHPSTVTGLAFDGKGKRLGASHYNGASLWFTAASTSAARVLEWKGSHTGIALHPAGEAVVTSMQENALHGWRLPDGHDMRMSGYPQKSESLSFTRNGKYLASSGADAIILWPFFGGGPMGKPPLELGVAPEGVVCTRVASHPRDDMVAAGYSNGMVLLADILSKRLLVVTQGGRGPVSALAWSGDGVWLALGTETGFAALVNFSKR